MHYEVIFLIISSNNEDVYSEMRKLSPNYYDLYSDKIKYFFIENKDNQSDDIIECGNYLYVSGNESFIPGIYRKSIKAIEYVTNKYSFDYVIRTNLSTFWNMPNLFTYLSTAPNNNLASSYSFMGFLSGTSIILSRDVGIIVYSNPNDINIGDDLAISQTIQANGIDLYNITEYKWGFLIPPNDVHPSNCRYLTMDDTDFSDILIFRIKNPDRKTDIICFKFLLKQLYNIQIDPIVINNTSLVLETMPSINNIVKQNRVSMLLKKRS